MYNETIGNRGGIPFIAATQTNAGSATANASYTLPGHAFRFVSPCGLAVVNFSAATAATITGLSFVVNDVSLPVTDATDAAITSTVAAGTHIVTYNKYSNNLKLIV